MLLRPRQQELVDRAVTALHQHGNTLAVAPTGAGKTIMLSSVIGALCKTSTAKTCVVAHRDELTVQNEAKFRRVNPHLSTGIFDASEKSWQGDTTFAMVQTLSRMNHLEAMPSLDLLVIDEAHHGGAESYKRIVNHAKKLNPRLKLLGMTATPNRGDKKGLSSLFSNVCDQITLQELIASGHLVRPRTFVMDVGVQKRLKDVKKTGGDYDAEDVAQIMDTLPIHEAVVAHWREKAGDRQTVVFCSTVDHARHVCEAFLEAGIAAVLVYGEMSEKEREEALKAYCSGAAQVIVNVSVLIEGWDHPPTSCVVLLRPCSYQSTFIQMIGRGLRTICEEEYPGVIKKDCLVLDFGTATLAHGSLEQKVELEEGKQQKKEGTKEDAKTKDCPQCEGIVPIAIRECPLCGFEFPSAPQKELPVSLTQEDFVMREINIFKKSHFLWLPLGQRQDSFMASGFEAWGSVFFKKGQWYAIAGSRKDKTRLLAVGDKTACVAAANDWMNLKESKDSAHKVKGWLNLPATSNQLRYLPEHTGDYHLTRYKASILMTLKFNAKTIEKALRLSTTQGRSLYAYYS